MREGRGDGLYIRGERGVQVAVPRGMVTNHIHDGRVSAARVVEVGETIGKAGPQVKQGGRRLVGHSPVAVRGACHHVLLESENSAHSWHAIECGDEMHFRRAGVRYAEFNPGRDQGSEQALGTVHFCVLSGNEVVNGVIVSGGCARRKEWMPGRVVIRDSSPAEGECRFAEIPGKPLARTELSRLTPGFILRSRSAL